VLAHYGYFVLKAGPDAFQVDRDDCGELGRFTVGDGDPDLGARIVYGGVEPTETANRRIDECRDFALDRHVSMHVCGRATRSSDAIDGLLAGGLNEVVHDHCRAARREIFSDCPAAPEFAGVRPTL
jgi:hypothetical protein